MHEFVLIFRLKVLLISFLGFKVFTFITDCIFCSLDDLKSHFFPIRIL